METTTLRSLLTILCANSPWKYAVFWRIKHQDRTLLAWEDGYCDDTKKGEPFRGKPDDGCSIEDSRLLPFADQQGIANKSSTDFSIGYMSCFQYELGEGVIGGIALTENDNWVFYNCSICGDLCSSKPEFPEEWHLQVTAGIKTILLVSILPHGVLQLGSFDKVAENLSLVSEIKEIFNSSLYKQHLMQSASSENVCLSFMSRIPVVKNDEAKPWCTKLPSELQFEYAEVISNEKLIDSQLFNDDEPVPLFAVHNMAEVIKSDLSPVPENSCESDLSNSSFDTLNQLDLVNQCMSIDAQETIYDLLSSCMDDIDEVIHCSLLCDENDDDDAGLSGDTSGEIANLFTGELSGESMTFSDNIYPNPIISGTLFSSPVDFELHKGLGPYFQGENDDIYTSSTITETLFSYPVDWDLYEPNYYECVSPTYLFSNDHLINGFEFDPSPLEYCGYLDGDNHEDLLQDVIPSIFEKSDDITSCTVLSSKSSITALVKTAASSPELSLSEETAEEPVPPSHGSMPPFIGMDDFHRPSTLAPLTKSGISTLTVEKKPKKRSYGPSGKGANQTSTVKKARTNNGHKPRPRDRQLIQDRLKELRELVPNGEKCSIDGLLDKAIKHMQFLANVTEQAEKLSHTVDKEIVVDEKLNEANSQQKGGGNWEMENGLKLYPITVKDLPRPGSMLIEMACNEQELFFEVTEVISRLGLTILKSVLETNSDNTKARYIIEAPRGFAKMEIFFPLMQLLQRHRNRSTMPGVI